MRSRGTAPARARAGRKLGHRTDRKSRLALRERVGRRASDAAVTLAYRHAAVAACVHLTSLVFAVTYDDVMLASRGGPTVARARQVAVYLAHVVFSIPQSDLAEAFGRERTTVVWTCHRVEDDRDDGEFEIVLNQMERMLGAVREGFERCAAEGGRPSFDAEMGASA